MRRRRMFLSSQTESSCFYAELVMNISHMLSSFRFFAGAVRIIFTIHTTLTLGSIMLTLTETLLFSSS